MAKTIYLIDTENVQYAYEQVIPNLKPGDEVILFCTEHTMSMQARFSTLEKISRIDASIKVIACGSGHNALDFQLASYLGWLIREDYTAQVNAKPGTEPCEYIVFSGDHGYDPLQAFWADYGYKVTVRRPFPEPQETVDTATDTNGHTDLIQELPPKSDPEACAVTAKPDAQTHAYNNDGKRPKKHAKKQDDGPARGIKPLDECCLDYEKSIRGITGYYGKWAGTISSAMAACVKLPAKSRAPKYRSILTKKLGKENGPAVYKKTKPLLDDFVVNGPWPYEPLSGTEVPS